MPTGISTKPRPQDEDTNRRKRVAPAIDDRIKRGGKREVNVGVLPGHATQRRKKRANTH